MERVRAGIEALKRVGKRQFLLRAGGIWWKSASFVYQPKGPVALVEQFGCPSRVRSIQAAAPREGAVPPICHHCGRRPGDDC
jgi:hypothetical protein